MLLPPILEVFVFWHPADRVGEKVASWLLDHFHGPAFSGLIGGAVEVYTRSAGWDRSDGPPRPLSFSDGAVPDAVAPPTVTAVLPVLGRNLAQAVDDSPDWHAFVAAAVHAQQQRDDVLMFPLLTHGHATAGTLGTLLDGVQRLPDACVDSAAELGREVAQGIVQHISGTPDTALQVFVSHTKRHSPDEEPDHVDRLVQRILGVLRETRLVDFFDVRSLQSGERWEGRIEAEAARGCLLMVRTDRYAGRQMCQREVRIAKEAGVPVVELAAVTGHQERGSFLLDHVPSVQTHLSPSMSDEELAEAADEAIRRAVNLLVDEALKRALWARQRTLLTGRGFAWLPSHAPEPLTALRHLIDHPDVRAGDHCVVLHPDPPLLPDEEDTLSMLFDLAGFGGRLDIVTPRTFAQRGGQASP